MTEVATIQKNANGELPVVRPRVDIYENTADEHQGLTVVADMPGASKEGLTVRLDPGANGTEVLTIEALASTRLDDEHHNFRYRRSFVLDRRVDPDRIEARLHNGELRIELPAAPEVRARRIEVVEA